MRINPLLPITLAICCMLSCRPAQEENLSSIETLAANFDQPPSSCKPWTWWHWIDGNITRKGITNDLEAMQRAGIGAAMVFNVRLGFPDGPARFMTEDWLGLLEHAVAEADRLGMLLGIHNCDGWSQAGGPWITPEMSMKQLTWSTVEVEGPVRYERALPQPPVPESPLVNGFYRDIAVLAYPAPEGDRINRKPDVLDIEGSLSENELMMLLDENPESHAEFMLQSEGTAVEHVVTMHFPEASKARSMVFHGIEGYNLPQVIPGTLEVAGEGQSYREVASFELNWSFHGAPLHTVTVGFPETEGSSYRIRFKGEHIFSPALSISEIELSTRPALHYWEVKTGWARAREHGGEAPFLKRDPGPEARKMDLPAGAVIPAGDIRVFRDQIGPNGTFNWEVPEGKWIIQRIGYTSTGKTNSPATDEGRGLEADKLDPDAVRFHMEQFIGMLAKRFEDKQLRSFRIFETDSWESGSQTWTEGLNQRFENAMGQDLVAWLPLLTEGILIEGYDESDRFLYDWRRFMADQFNQHYYQVTAAFAEENDLIYVGEASGRQMFMYDPVSYQRIPAIPMGEFWVNKDTRGQGVRVDNKVASSAAHITGKRWVASESYTSPPQSCRWDQHPFTLKALGDEAFCAGVNKFVFHTYAHQPYPDLKPGFTMARWGMHNHSGNTWWDGPVSAWMDYLSRCQYLLSEGRFHADILAFLGDEVPARLGRRHEFRPQIPPGYDFDGCDFQALLDARVEDGEIVLTSGMRYRILLLPDQKHMPVAVTRRITELADAGALIVSATKPETSPVFDEAGEADQLVADLADQYWGQTTSPRQARGKVILSRDHDLGSLMKELGIPPDFGCTPGQQAEILFIHRKMADADVYFLSNQQNEPVSAEVTFRQPARKQVSRWDPSNGRKTPVRNITHPAKQLTRTTLTMDPFGSCFIVFSDAELPLDPVLRESQSLPLEGPWNLQFQSGRGAPVEPMQINQLIDWTQHENFGIRHFSGTATYSRSFNIPPDQFTEHDHLLLDLGEVHEMAEVLVNGQHAGTLWKPPYRIEITGLTREGENELEIRVTNLWANRLIGDEHFPEEMEWRDARGSWFPVEWPDWMTSGDPRPPYHRITWTPRGRIYSEDDPLLPSGLLGPVALITAAAQN